MKLAIIFLFSLGFLVTFGQKDGTSDRSYIVQIADRDHESVIEDVSQALGIKASDIEMKSIFEEDIYSLHIRSDINIKKSSVINKLHATSSIRQFQPNLKTEWRKEPNDPEFSIQNNLKLIGLDEAWNFTTGGSSLSGHEIVVSVVDDGFDISHEDIDDRIWVNKAEIPDNGIDDDDNGYIDDVIGINTRNGSGVHEVKSHGTSVMGIVGAEGNNNMGITGVMWDVKILLISNIQFADDIIEGFDYIREQRERFNDSDGREGSYIVANNYSGGIPDAFEEDQPILCDIINRLGEQGILTIVSAPNQDLDIDIAGDLPADCSSDHLIVVTNTAVQEDEKFTASGFGVNNVDLGAPGRGVTSIRPNNEYEPFGGTSASAPHVAGVISLLYSLPCEFIDSQSLSNPEASSLFIKDLILSNTDQKSSLAGITTSGGRLSAIKPIIAARDLCFEIPEEITITVTPNPILKGATFDIEFQTPFLDDHEFSLYSMAGDLIYHETLRAPISGRGFINLPERLLDTHEGLFNIIIRTETEKATSRFVLTDASN